MIYDIERWNEFKAITDITMQQRPIVILLAIQPRTEHMIIQRKDFQKNHFEFDNTVDFLAK